MQLNIIAAWNALPSSTKQAGALWYPLANFAALDIARATGHEHSRVCGVIARLSPSCPWEANLEATRTLCQYGTLDSYQGYGQNIQRARDILENGWSDAPYGHKVNAFYRNIVDPRDPEPVTIDRHMLWWMGEDRDKRIHKARYEQLSRPWRGASREIGIPACAIQAAIWVDAKKRKLITG